MAHSLLALPTDRFIARRERVLLPEEERVLSLLYQPIVGGEAIAVYHSFNQLIAEGKSASSAGLHRWFPPLFQFTWSQFIEAKERLEGVGLLRTYYKPVAVGRTEEHGARARQDVIIKQDELQEDHIFYYHLQLPLSSAGFFKSDVLSVMLLNRVGQTLFRFLRQQFQVERLEDSNQLTEMTKRFDEVFTTIRPSEVMLLSESETSQFFQELEKEIPLESMGAQKAGKEGVQVISSTLDMDAVYAMLPSFCQPRAGFTQAELRTFHELAFFYQLDEMQLVHFLQEPTLYDGENLDLKALRQSVRNWYQSYHQQETPVVISQRVLAAKQEARRKQVAQKEEARTPISTEDQYQSNLEQVSPITLLESHQQGAKVSSSDLKMIQQLLYEYELPIGVTNVLLEYVMYTHDRQLPAPLVYKIAAHWKRLNIRTAAEAMKKAKELHQLQQEQRQKKQKISSGSASKSTSSKSASYGKNTSQSGGRGHSEVKPAWLRHMEEEQQKKQTQSHDQEAANKPMDPAEEKEILELLRALGEIQ